MIDQTKKVYKMSIWIHIHMPQDSEEYKYYIKEYSWWEDMSYCKQSSDT